MLNRTVFANRGETDRRLLRSGLAARFATCPPRFALLLDLRKTHNQPALVDVVSSAPKNAVLATVMACLPQRNKGGGRRPGDIRGGRYAVAVAG